MNRKSISNLLIIVIVVITMVVLITTSTILVGIMMHAYAQLDLTQGRIAPWYEIGSPSDCGDKDPDPMCCQGCPLDDAKYMGTAGFRPLVGVWQMVNITKDGIVDKNTSGVATFSVNGSYDLMFPKPVEISFYGDMSRHVGDYWASDGHSLVVTYGDMLAYAEMKFIKKSHDHMELSDGHSDTIHLIRLEK